MERRKEGRKGGNKGMMQRRKEGRMERRKDGKKEER